MVRACASQQEVPGLDSPTRSQKDQGLSLSSLHVLPVSAPVSTTTEEDFPLQITVSFGKREIRVQTTFMTFLL